jgi:hypothetical protein
MRIRTMLRPVEQNHLPAVRRTRPIPLHTVESLCLYNDLF